MKIDEVIDGIYEIIKAKASGSSRFVKLNCWNQL